MTYSIRMWQEMAGDNLVWLASHPELEGCFTQGKTFQEASDNLAEVRELLLAHDRENNLPIPDPQPGQVILNVQLAYDATQTRFVPWEAQA